MIPILPNSAQIVTPNCTYSTSTCNGGSVYGIQENVYKATVTLPPCNKWTISHSSADRNDLTTASSAAYYIPTVLYNSNIGNSSPILPNHDKFLLCHGQQYNISFAANDPDGDSLVYELYNPFTSSMYGFVSYYFPYAYTNFMSSIPYINLDPQTGILSLRPLSLLTSVYGVRITEWRTINGVPTVVGERYRDVHVKVINCANTLPQLAGFDVNGSQSYDPQDSVFHLSICPNSLFQINIYGNDSDLVDTSNVGTKEVFTLSWNQGISGASFQAHDSHTDSAYATFSWTPTTADIQTSPHCFDVEVRDDACPFYGYGKEIHYQVVAVDSSAAANIGRNPSLSYRVIKADFAPSIGSVLWTEGFENGIPATWEQATDDDFDWTTNSGTTSTSMTGPNGAYNGTEYIYTEANSNTFEKANIITPILYLDAVSNPVLEFYYHMYGYQTGSVHIDVLYQNVWHNDVLVFHGQKQSSSADLWKRAAIDLSAFKDDSTRVRFRGIVGSGARSDMAIDDVSLGSRAGLAFDAGINEIRLPSTGIAANVNTAISALLQNYSNDTLTSTTIGWSVNGTANSNINWTGSLLPNDTVLVSLGNVNVPGGSHIFKSWTANPNGGSDLNIANDTNILNVQICSGALSGTYTIGGSSASFADFNSAVLALTSCGVSGPVIFNVDTTVFEEQVIIPAITGVSATNTVTFQAFNGDSSKAVLRYNSNSALSNYTLLFDGASFITFKNINIQSRGYLYGRAIEFRGDNHDINLLNNVISGRSTSASYDYDMKILVFALDSIGSNFSIKNNIFQFGSKALALLGKNASNITIENNEFNNQYTGALSLNNLISPVVSANEVFTNKNYNQYYGIQLMNCTGAPMISANNLFIPNTSRAVGIATQDYAGSATDKTKVYNNMVSMRTSSTSPISSGILVQDASNTELYFNTVNLFGNANNSSALSLVNTGTATTDDILVKNNILVNRADGFAMRLSGLDTSKVDNDFNNLFDYNKQMLVDNNGFTIADLAAWQIASGTQNSLDYNPLFPSDTNIVTVNNALNASGTPITGITVDVHGESRDLTNPDMGADEFVQSPFDVELTEILSPIGGCGLTNAEDVEIRMVNRGSSAIASGAITASYQLDNNTIVSETVNTTIPVGGTLDFTFTQKADLFVSQSAMQTTYSLWAKAQLSGDGVMNNDSVNTDIVSKYLPSAPIMSDTTIKFGNTVDLIAGSSGTFYWYADQFTNTKLDSVATFTTPILFDTTTFWVAQSAVNPGIDATANGTFSSNGNIYGNMFDIVASANVQIKGFDINLKNSGQAEIEVFQRNGTHVGHETNSSSWTLLGTYTVTSAGLGNPTYLNLGAGAFSIQSGQSAGIYIRTTGTFSNRLRHHKTANNSNIGDSRVKYTKARQSGATFSTVKTTLYRKWNGNIHYAYGGSPIIQSPPVCFSPRVPVKVSIKGFPADNASVSGILNPINDLKGDSATVISVKLKNNGTNNLASAKLYWSFNGLLQDSIAWTGNLSPNGIDTINIDTASFSLGTNCIKVWSGSPNALLDSVPNDDTSSLCFQVRMLGLYTIGDTSVASYDFPNFVDAADALESNGILGAVTIAADTGTYFGTFSLPEVYGAGPNARVTFTSISQDSSKVTILDSAGLANPYLVQLDGADYITFSHLGLSTVTNPTYNRNFDLKNGTDYIEISNCLIIGTPATSSTNDKLANIYSKNNIGRELLVKNNTIKDGLYGII
jgi:hypothetical protein